MQLTQEAAPFLKLRLPIGHSKQCTNSVMLLKYFCSHLVQCSDPGSSLAEPGEQGKHYKKKKRWFNKKHRNVV